MSTHERYQELAAAAIDFDLGPAEKAELADHLATCAPCRRGVAALESDARAIVTLAALPVPDGVRDRALRRRRRPSAIGFTRALALAATLTLLGLLGIVAAGEMLRRSQDPLLVDARTPESTGAPNSIETSGPGAACGDVGGPVFGVGEGADPEIREKTFEIGGESFSTLDVQVGVLAVIELAWVTRQQLCIQRPPGAPPSGVSAKIEACGEVVVGATWFLFQTGSGGVTPDNQDDLRQGVIHDTLLGFRLLDVSGDAQPPNLMSALALAASVRGDQDCLSTSVAWTAGEDAILETEVTTSVCFRVIEQDTTTFGLANEDYSRDFPFKLTAGSAVDAAFEPGELGGAQVTAQRGLDGAVNVAPSAVDGCPDANASLPPPPTPG